jgi:hypothetical protein
MTLCSHVDIQVDGDLVTVKRGVADPFYGWSPELQGDVPLLRCSECRAVTPLPGVGVRREGRAVSANRQEGWELL